ncbi:wax ester/triacylglycerol synthase family O-acyltransferase [Marinobacter goseongensis]|uniref:wax ester/triacylglycerol synthase family O-acyltransferase n=1 Tax=Marinobacter goseongensis TaxID=453838 RepID=UPI00200321BB|nr:wax ester/triacylglycerol synthase family O-acyltransferase [Marinobacter goseongensis]MCK7550331.1 wax ester/triacylglycerol synthase family O-acyltransferase [Marinobacter goseongensis]
MNQEDSHLLLPVDSAWLALERPENPMTITVMMRVEGLTESRLRAFLDIYWLAWARFRYLPVRRAPGWWWQEDTVFDLRHHLKVAPEPFTNIELQQWVSARLNQPLPPYRPLWKFWLAPHAEGGAALILRMHHCYADGLSLLSVFERICPPSPRQLPAIYGGPEQADLQRWSMAAGSWLKDLIGEEVAAASGSRSGNAGGETEGMSGSLESAGRVLERVAHSGLKLVNEVSQFLVEPEDSPSALKRPLLGRRQCCWSAPVALDRFQQIATTTGVTINDVLLSCVAAAVRKQLAAGQSDLDEAVLHAAVPVDIRSQLPAGIKPDPGALGNCFGTVFVPLPVDGASPLERLYRIKHETRRLKKSWQPGIAWGLTASASLVPEPWRQPVADVFYRKASAVVSNVPGSREERYLAGCRITEQMFWVPQAGDIGLGVSIVSYAGQVQFGIVADEAVLDSPSQFLADCLEELHAFSGS